MGDRGMNMLLPPLNCRMKRGEQGEPLFLFPAINIFND